MLLAAQRSAWRGFAVRGVAWRSRFDFRYSETQLQALFSVFRNTILDAMLSLMPKDLADRLRAAIRQSGKPLLTIAQDTGVGVATLSEFMSGADMRLATASKIAAYLNLELKRASR